MLMKYIKDDSIDCSDSWLTAVDVRIVTHWGWLSGKYIRHSHQVNMAKYVTN
ncbi:hypothetical protein BC833DRAFT_609813 [Globomyces pollinis-pini]|nr:hypothetical protein BC833DRAFT_609813 [Globomyces pollinis-pini]